MNNQGYSYQFSIFRIYLGFYSAVVLMLSLKSSTILWSNEGFIPNARLNLTFGVFPNVLNHFDSPNQITLFLTGLIVLSILFSLGIYRRIVAILLWYGLTCLLNRNNLIINPSIHFNGWLLLCCSIIPSGEPWALSKQRENWSVPSITFFCGWILFSSGHFLSGFDKLFSESWIDGTAFQKIIDGPMGSSFGARMASLLPDWLMHALTWTVIAAEMICLPLAIFSRTKKWAWLICTLLQLNILVFLSVPVISTGMLAFHLFLFDPKWFNVEEFFNKLQHKVQSILKPLTHAQ